MKLKNLLIILDMRNISQVGIDLIKKWEGLHDGDLSVIGLQPKMCPAGIWTVGYGHALKDDKGKWLKGKKDFRRIPQEWLKITKEQAETVLMDDLKIFEFSVNNLVKVRITQNQFDALVSFTFNLGAGNLRRSDLLKYVNKSNFLPAAAEFTKWVMANGEVLPGLKARRQREIALFVKNLDDLEIPEWAHEQVRKARKAGITTSLILTAGEIPLYQLLKLIDKYNGR